MRRMDRLAIGDHSDRSWIDVACLEASLHEMFLTVATISYAASISILTIRIGPSPTPSTPGSGSGETDAAHSAMTRRSAYSPSCGSWTAGRLCRNPAPLARTQRRPPRHCHSEVSIEIKGTRVRSDGPARHRIASLDQLADPETGQLLLFSCSEPRPARSQQPHRARRTTAGPTPPRRP